MREDLRCETVGFHGIGEKEQLANDKHVMFSLLFQMR